MYQDFAKDVCLAPFTTYHIGGNADYFTKVYDVEGLKRALQISENRLILGKGSKLLISDKGFRGIAILIKMTDIRFYDDFVYAEAGASLPILSRLFYSNSIKGLEFASLIPASIGGAIKMNAGAHGEEISSLINYVDVLRDFKVLRLRKKDCMFSYRQSGFLSGDIILGASLIAKKGEKSEIEALRNEYIKKRELSQPKGFSCGSIFLSNNGESAYKFINECNLQGVSLGNAQISDIHSNFIINNGLASAKDVHTLIKTIKAEVFTKKGIKLKEEVIYIGEF